MNNSLHFYIENEILPRYRAFDAAHRIDHARAVIERSLELAACCKADPDMAYTVAAYHDLGLCDGRERHHLRSGELLAADPALRQWFSEEQIALMREAVEDHRASADREPRSVYGRIVAEADRCLDPDTVLRRTIQYGLEHHPDLDREEQYARCCDHLRRKYADGGYLRLWIPDSDNGRKLEELRLLIRRQDELRRRFGIIYEQVTAR